MIEHVVDVRQIVDLLPRSQNGGQNFFELGVVEADAGIDDRLDARGQHGDHAADQTHGGKHAVNAFAGDVLLIIADIAVDAGREDVRERIDHGVHPHARHDRPDHHARVDVARDGIHGGEEENVHHVGQHQRVLLADLLDADGRREHTPERGVPVQRPDQGVSAGVAGVLIGIEPRQDVEGHGLQKAEPARHGNDPEIFILEHGAERIDKFDLHHVRARLNDFLFCIDIDDEADEEAEDQHRRPDEAVNADIEQVFAAGDHAPRNGDDDVGDGRRERIGHGADRRHVRTFLRVGGKHHHVVVVSVEQKVIEELEADVEEQHGGVFADVVHVLIRRPNVAQREQHRGQAHGNDIGAVFALAVARVVDDVRAQRREREARQNADDVDNVHRAGLDADGIAHEHVAHADEHALHEGDDELDADAAPRQRDDLLIGHKVALGRRAPVALDFFGGGFCFGQNSHG